jgi:signal transduction histidine kinase
VVLCLVFPDGLLPGRLWRLAPWLFGAAALAVDVLLAIQNAGPGGSQPPGTAPPADFLVADVVAGVCFLSALGLAVASLVVRYRRGDELTRLQLRWLRLGAGSVPLLLAGGWIGETAGLSPEFAYAGFLAAMLLLVPVSVAIAILRHDLLDVDRLVSDSVSWLLTTLVSAAVFAAVGLGVSSALSSRAAVTLAAFVAALVLLPAHRWVHGGVGRVLDRERTVLRAGLQDFVARVRDGLAQPEEVQDVLRAALGDPALAVLLRLPGAEGYVDLAGSPATADDPERSVPLTARDSGVGVIVLGRTSARRRRLAREAAVAVRLPIEVSRLRLELRGALDDARSSRARLVEAITEERRRLERDLHDGAQQGIVAVGMRLRSVQRLHRPGDRTHQELDAAVAALEGLVAELRRLAHGIRPSRLDDGLEVAVRDLVSGSPIPVVVSVAAVGISDAVATTAYYLVAECLANTFKHAGASGARITISQGERLHVRVSDDGKGGARSGFGLGALRDRVAALGGHLSIDSPAGAGTTITAEL